MTLPGASLEPPAAKPAPPSGGLLAEITAGLAEGQDLQALLARFLAPIIRIAGARAGAVRVLDEDAHCMRLVGSLGLPQDLLEAERSVASDCGACGAAALGDRPVWGEDLAPCRQRSAGHAFFGGGAMRVLAVPLHHRARVLGVYSLFHDADAPSPQVLSLLGSVGDLLGLALHHARLERAQMRATLAQERQAMAAEVHDSIAQTLAFVKMRLPLLQQAVAQHDEPASRRYLDDVRDAIGQAHGGLRRIINEFRAPLDPLGWDHALQERMRELRERHGVQADWTSRVPVLKLSAAQEGQVVHIVGEALQNIARHALARRAWVGVSEHEGRVEVTVEDDGVGLRLSGGEDGHHGLDIMRERARRLGGELDVSPRRGGGTQLVLRFPVATATEPLQ